MSFLHKYPPMLDLLLVAVKPEYQNKGAVAEVISVGPGGNVDGKDVVMTVKPGEKVITSQYAGTKVTLEDVEYVVVRQNDILAIVE